MKTRSSLRLLGMALCLTAGLPQVTASPLPPSLTSHPDGGETAHELYVTLPGAAPYRIPAIASTACGDLLAFTDHRPCGSDIGYGEVDIMCRISRDGGRSWDEA
ncbi:MAG: exo-alpha-sialidase, partial [Prevotellamassilia sp.]|nr:exo-alpha-sialidase [Prevotellamassilia sp.]